MHSFNFYCSQIKADNTSAMVVMNIAERKAIRRLSIARQVGSHNNGPDSKHQSRMMKKKDRKRSLFPLSMGFGIHTQRGYNSQSEKRAEVAEEEVGTSV